MLVDTLAALPEEMRENAKTWARPFTARLLEPGIVSYEDRGCGVALLRKETIDRDIHTFIGRPVTIKHTKTSPSNMKEIGHGYVTEVFFNPSDGWWYGRGLADTDAAADEIAKKGLCSVGYKVTKTGPGGTWHDIDYHEEILGFSGEHLAIVGNPRYEEATIRLNSKTNQQNPIMLKLKFWKKSASRQNATEAPAADQAAVDKAAADKKAAEDAATRENSASEITGDSTLEIPGADGKPVTVSVNQLVEVYNAKKKTNDDGEEVDGESEVMVNGKKVKMNALVSAYNAANPTDEEKKDKENALAAEQATADAKAAEEKKTRENARPDHFRLLTTAATRPVQSTEKPSFDTQADRVNRGRELYGTTVTK